MYVDRFANIEMPPNIRTALSSVLSKLENMDDRDFLNRNLADPATYFLKKPGKLLRPTLVFLGADFIKIKKLDELVDIAVGIELLHTSSLLHDDIVDKDVKRRGIQTVHTKYGNEKAILAGDALISQAVQKTCKYGSEVVRNVSMAAMKMCAGEMIDYEFQSKGKMLSLAEYISIAEMKSSSLIGTATSIAAIYLNDKKAKELYEFGTNLGTAFQIRDDIIDYIDTKNGNSSVGGKNNNAPNIVKVIQENNKLSEDLTLSKAVELNRKYIDTAISEIGKRGLLSKYAKTIAIGDRIIDCF